MIVAQTVAYLAIGIGVLAMIVGSLMQIQSGGCSETPRSRIWRRIAMAGFVVTLLAGIGGATAAFASHHSTATPAAHVRSASTSRPSVSKSGVQR